MFSKWLEDPIGSIHGSIEGTRKQNPGEARLIRHGPKNGEDLDETRLCEIIAEADQYFEQLRTSPVGSVSTYHTSEFPRAHTTARLFISRIMERAHAEPDLHIKFITEEERTQGDLSTDTRWVVFDVVEDTGLGFKNGTSEARGAFEEYKTLFGGDGIHAEEMVAKLWIARGDEFSTFLARARAQIKTIHPEWTDAEIDVAIRTLNPARLDQTPEEHAIHQLETIRDTMARLHRDHPGRALYPTFVSHAPLIDFTNLALTGRKLTLANYEHQGISDYLEGASFKVNAEGVVVFAEGRGANFVTEVPLQTHITRLTKESAERRAEWERLFSN